MYIPGVETDELRGRDPGVRGGIDITGDMGEVFESGESGILLFSRKSTKTERNRHLMISMYTAKVLLNIIIYASMTATKIEINQP